MSQNLPEKSPVERFLEGFAAFSDALSWRLAVSTYVLGMAGWSEVPLGKMTERELYDALLEPFVERLWEISDEEVESELDTVIEEIKGELDTAIFEYFRRDKYARLSELVDGWDRFDDRHQVFEDALWVHKQGRYTLSIPALAAQFEGIVRDEVNDYGESTSWRNTFLDTFGHNREDPPLPSNLEDFLTEFGKSLIPERFSRVEEARKYFTLTRIQELFDRKDFKDPESSSTVNRHVILHGVFRTFEEFESLRLFFVLDLLHEAVGLYREAAN